MSLSKYPRPYGHGILLVRAKARLTLSGTFIYALTDVVLRRKNKKAGSLKTGLFVNIEVVWLS